MNVNFNVVLKYIIFNSLFGLLFFLVINASFAAEPVDRIVAVVNNDVVMLSELEEKVRTVTSQMQQNNTPVPPQPILEKEILERIIISKLQLQYAERTGIRVDDETLNRSVSNMAAQNGVSLKEFREILEDRTVVGG